MDSAALSVETANADAVQIILPPPPQAEDAVGEMRLIVESLAEALGESRPNRVLAISDYGAHAGEGVGMPFMFHLFENRLRQLKMHKVFLRSAEHMEGWVPFIQVASATDVLPSLHHPVEAESPTVSAPDVGRIAADLLRNVSAGTEEQIVHVEGPRRYSANDVAAALSQLLGRSVRAQALPRAQWQESLEQGLSASAAKLVVDGLRCSQQEGTHRRRAQQGRGSLRHDRIDRCAPAIRSRRGTKTKLYDTITTRVWLTHDDGQVASGLEVGWAPATWTVRR